MQICKVFEDERNFPHCVGAMDGKHVLQSPIKSGSEFFNYKKQFSIVCALVDGHYNFIFADVGCEGRISDSGIFNNSTLCTMMTDNTLGFPAPTELSGRQMKVPYFIAADRRFCTCRKHNEAILRSACEGIVPKNLQLPIKQRS